MIANLDPRTKLLLTVLYSALIVRSDRLDWLAIELGVLVLLILGAREGRTYVGWLRLAGLMTGTWFAIAWLSFDLGTAITASLRLLALTTAFFVFFRTTTPEDLGNALVQTGLPYAFAFILSTSLQFVPVMTRKARNIFDAQRARGIPLEPGLPALRHYPALLVPLLIQAFQMADELAEAMEARGFSRPGRTFVQTYRLTARDWLALGGASLALAVVWMVR